MNKSCSAICAAVLGICAASSPTTAQTFFAYAAGGGTASLRGAAYVCEIGDGNPYIVLSDSTGSTVMSFLFDVPVTEEQNTYPIGTTLEEGSAFFSYHTGKRTVRDYRETKGMITVTAGNARMIEADFEVTGERAGESPDVIAGSFSAVTLGLNEGECNPQAKEQRVRALGWPAAITRSILARDASVGMTADMLREVWGTPRHVSRTRTAAGSTEMWIYTNTRVLLRDGKVAEIQEG